MFKHDFRIAAAVVISAFALSQLVGCEDGNAQERAAIQTKLLDAGKALQNATAAAFVPDSEEFTKSRAALDGVVKTLNAINPADEGQRAAKSMLSASAMRELAVMDYTKASALEHKQSDTRAVLQSRVDAITTLDALADGQQTINAAPDEQALEAERQDALKRINELGQRIEELAGPINERTTKNDTDKKEVDRLKAEVNDLRRTASEKGNADGFTTYQQAIDTRRRADKIEYEISQREMELGYSLQPDHDMADAQSKGLQSRIDSLKETSKELDGFSKGTAQEIVTTREQITTFSTELAKELKQVSETAANELAPLYEQADAALQKAVSMAQAGGAAGGDDANAAKLLKARCLELRGKFQALKAQGLAEQKALLQKLSDAGKAVANNEDVKKDLDAASTALAAATEQAKAAYTEAMDAISQVKIRGDEMTVESIRKNLENAVAIISGQKAAEPSKGTSAPAGNGNTPAPTAAAPTSGGSPGNFATYQQLYTFLNGLPETLDGARQVLAVSHVQTTQGRLWLDSSQKVTDALIALDQALQEKFSTDLSKSAGPILSALLKGSQTKLSGAKITEQDEEHVVYAVNMGGQTIPMALRKVDASWWLDLDGQANAFARMLPKMMQMNKAITDACNASVHGVKSGQIASAQDAVTPVEQAAAQAASAGGPTGGSESGP